MARQPGKQGTGTTWGDREARESSSPGAGPAAGREDRDASQDSGDDLDEGDLDERTEQDGDQDEQDTVLLADEGLVFREDPNDDVDVEEKDELEIWEASDLRGDPDEPGRGERGGSGQ